MLIPFFLCFAFCEKFVEKNIFSERDIYLFELRLRRTAEPFCKILLSIVLFYLC